LKNSLAGKLIVASPGMDDPNFEHTVILLVEHNAEGAMGLVINRPTDTHIDEVWSQISSGPCTIDQTISRGGPCPGPLMLLHNHSSLAQIEVCQGVCYTSEQLLVHELLEERPATVNFFLGYAGWGPGQLEGELRTGSWLVTPASAAVVFDPDPDDGLWMRVITGIDRAMAMLAINPRLIPTDPKMN